MSALSYYCTIIINDASEKGETDRFLFINRIKPMTIVLYVHYYYVHYYDRKLLTLLLLLDSTFPEGKIFRGGSLLSVVALLLSPDEATVIAVVAGPPDGKEVAPCIAALMTVFENIPVCGAGIRGTLLITLTSILLLLILVFTFE